MKKLIAIFAFLALSAGIAGAQDTKAAQVEAQETTDKMVKNLELNEEQTTLVYRQNYERALQVAKLRTMDVSDEQKNKLIKDQYAVYEGELKKILTADQFTKWLSTKEKHKSEAVKEMKN